MRLLSTQRLRAWALCRWFPRPCVWCREAFDALSNALGESAADKMSDAVAATVAEAAATEGAQLKSSAEDDTNDQHEAVTTLAMLVRR